jgi:hypothetical protein
MKGRCMMYYRLSSGAVGLHARSCGGGSPGPPLRPTVGCALRATHDPPLSPALECHDGLLGLKAEHFCSDLPGL